MQGKERIKLNIFASPPLNFLLMTLVIVLLRPNNYQIVEYYIYIFFDNDIKLMYNNTILLLPEVKNVRAKNLQQRN